MAVPESTQTRFVGITYHIHYTSLRVAVHTHTILYMGHMHAGMENQYMDQYQNNIIATLYILNLNQECMMLIIEKSKHRDV